MTVASSKRLYNIATAVLLAAAAGTWLQTLWAAQHQPLLFDDAYMFARYAENIRHGLGFSWNPDGVHTYGPTSLLWSFAVLVLSFLPLATWKMLTLGSWLCSLGAVVAIAWAVAGSARSEFFRSTWRVLPWVVLPLSATMVFTANQVTGMETMLAALLAALYLGLSLAWHRGTVRAEMVALVGILLFLARPESAAAAVLLPVLLFALLPGRAVTIRGLAVLLTVLFLGILASLGVCQVYFHSMFPLSFYMKSRHGYEGLSAVWHSEILLVSFFVGAKLYLLGLVLLARKQDWPLIACCLIPALVVFAYLETVTQIMGFNSRYYAPYFAFFIVPALLVLDRWFVSEEPETALWPGRVLRTRGAIAAFVLFVCIVWPSESVQAMVRRKEHRVHYEYDPAQLSIASATPLPELDWQTAMTDISDDLVAGLPAGAVVAASEAGYIGVRAPQVSLIDLAGLNDNQIALHGFDMPSLLARKPDVIWMPHSQYTYQRGIMFKDPAMLAQYDVYAGAGLFGLAVRKDSPLRPILDRQMAIFWAHAYPHSTMSDYLVTSATWSGKKHDVIGD